MASFNKRSSDENEAFPDMTRTKATISQALNDPTISREMERWAQKRGIHIYGNSIDTGTRRLIHNLFNVLDERNREFLEIDDLCRVADRIIGKGNYTRRQMKELLGSLDLKTEGVITPWEFMVFMASSHAARSMRADEVLSQGIDSNTHKDLLGINHIDMKLYDMFMSYYRKRYIDAIAQRDKQVLHMLMKGIPDDSAVDVLAGFSGIGPGGYLQKQPSVKQQLPGLLPSVSEAAPRADGPSHPPNVYNGYGVPLLPEYRQELREAAGAVSDGMLVTPDRPSPPDQPRRQLSKALSLSTARRVALAEQTAQLLQAGVKLTPQLPTFNVFLNSQASFNRARIGSEGGNGAGAAAGMKLPALAGPKWKFDDVAHAYAGEGADRGSIRTRYSVPGDLQLSQQPGPQQPQQLRSEDHSEPQPMLRRQMSQPHPEQIQLQRNLTRQRSLLAGKLSRPIPPGKLMDPEYSVFREAMAGELGGGSGPSSGSFAQQEQGKAESGRDAGSGGERASSVERAVVAAVGGASNISRRRRTTDGVQPAGGGGAGGSSGAVSNNMQLGHGPGGSMQRRSLAGRGAASNLRRADAGLGALPGHAPVPLLPQIAA